MTDTMITVDAMLASFALAELARWEDDGGTPARAPRQYVSSAARQAWIDGCTDAECREIDRVEDLQSKLHSRDDRTRRTARAELLKLRPLAVPVGAVREDFLLGRVEVVAHYPLAYGSRGWDYLVTSAGEHFGATYVTSEWMLAAES